MTDGSRRPQAAEAAAPIPTLRRKAKKTRAAAEAAAGEAANRRALAGPLRCGGHSYPPHPRVCRCKPIMASIRWLLDFIPRHALESPQSRSARGPAGMQVQRKLTSLQGDTRCV